MSRWRDWMCCRSSAHSEAVTLLRSSWNTIKCSFKLEHLNVHHAAYFSLISDVNLGVIHGGRERTCQSPINLNGTCLITTERNYDFHICQASSMEEAPETCDQSNSWSKQFTFSKLTRLRVVQQRYHGGAFVGNHVAKALKKRNIEKIIQAPVDTAVKFVHL